MEKMKSADIDKFLQKVDDIESVIKGLVTNDESAVEKADILLQQFEEHDKKDTTVFDRSVINDEAFKKWNNTEHGSDSGAELTGDTADAEAFMRIMEQDCRERAERRKKAEIEAEQLKLKGNAEFAQQNFAKAVEIYTEALTHVRHWTVLYTNRAQAYLQLGNYEAALDDCKLALKVDDKCIKAYILQGKSFLGLKDYEKALMSFHDAEKNNPAKKKLIAEYIANVQLVQQAEVEEKAADECMAVSEHGRVVNVLEKVRKPDQIPEYYTGGLQLMRKMLKDTSSRTLFRKHGGFELWTGHSLLSRCLTAAPESISAAEAETCASFIEVLIDACWDNECNQHQVLSLENFPNCLLSFIENGSEQGCIVAPNAVKLLLLLSQTAHGRSEILALFDVVRLISVAFLKAQTEPSSSIAINSQQLISNLAVEPKFRRQVYQGFETDVLPSFESLLGHIRSGNLLNISLSIKLVVNLCGDSWLRRKIASRLSTWKATCVALQHLCSSSDDLKYEVVCSILDLLANMAFDGVCKDDGIYSVCVELCSVCCDSLMPVENMEVTDGCLILLNRLLRVDAISSQCGNCHCRVVRCALKLIGQKLLTKHAVVCLAACTMHSAEAREEIVSFTKGLKMLLDLLSESDDITVGNAALCLGHCAQIKRVCKALTKTNIVMDLLVLARDQAKPSVQHNCAILIAKLAQGHHKHLDRLRELHGLEILNTVLKHVDG